MLRTPDRVIRHCRIADDGTEYHLFFGHAARDSAGRGASIGHAISRDLRSWQLLPDAVTPIEGPAWDDLGACSGTAVRGPDGRWRLFYTGLNRGEGGLVQRIGVAVSEDLIVWTRPTEPRLAASPTWYEKLDLTGWQEEVWRDPFVFADPGGNGYHMLIGARAAAGLPTSRGIIAHARSTDLDTWNVLPPLTSPAGFGEFDTPQSTIVDGQPLLLFSCPADMQPKERTSDSGVWVAPGESRLGPWDVSRAQPIDAQRLDSGQFVRDRTGQWMVLGTRDGEVVDPVPVRYGDRGLEVLPAESFRWDG